MTDAVERLQGMLNMLQLAGLAGDGETETLTIAMKELTTLRADNERLKNKLEEAGKEV